MLLPHNAPDAAKNVAYMVDEIWYHAGDTSTDVCSKIFLPISVSFVIFFSREYVVS